MNQQTKGQVAVLICAILWSSSGLFIRLVDWHPIVIAGTRSFIAALFMLALRLRRRRREKTEADPRYVWAAGFAYAATMVLFVIANKLTTSANAILLQYSSPVWAAILGWLIAKEKPHTEHWGALAMVMAGLVVFFKDSLAAGSLMGDGIAVLSGITFGANSVFMRMQKEGDPADSMLLAHFITALFSLPFIFMYPPELNGGSISAILFMGMVQIGAASLFFSYGIRRITAVQAMLTAVIEPVLNPVWVLLVTGEKPSLSAVIGGGIIVAAVVISSVISRRRKLQPSEGPAAQNELKKS
ncbi:DMT family transporter [Treponema sp. OttesenSCG-928-L16]|nr:DMT family transporter [Treponema sp. OttesenSCG-928-L16]